LDELDGAVVNVELVRYPRQGASPTGRVIEILGRPGELGVDIEIIIRKHHLPHTFSRKSWKRRDFAQSLSAMRIERGARIFAIYRSSPLTAKPRAI